MELVFEQLKGIPKLAWSLRMDKGADSVKVQHGGWVETGAQFFVEGAWAGDYQNAQFDTRTLMGSGGKVSAGKLILVCPNHTLDRIYSCLENDHFFASNSLPFLLSRLNDELDPDFLFYDGLLASIVEGINGYERFLPTKAGRQIQLHYHCNLRVGTDLRVLECPKDKVRDFNDYREYVEFLSDQVAEICANATDESRTVCFSPMATISSGYDSPACTVLARDVGCRAALTFSEARRVNTDDSGHLIAGKLGLNVNTFDRMEYKSWSNFPEAECAGGPSEFSSVVAELEQTVLFVGFNGDKIWNRCALPSTSIVRSDASGFSLTELRLRVGFILMAVPFIGCTSHPSIHKISNSEEMKPWSLNNRYDRPIPRRLVEENGVPREWFGINKRATAVYVTQEGVKHTLSPNSYRDFMAFCDVHWRMSFALSSRLVKVARSYSRFCARINTVLPRVTPEYLRFIRIPSFLPRGLRIRTYGYLGREALLFHWGVEKMLERYASGSECSDDLIRTTD